MMPQLTLLFAGFSAAAVLPYWLVPARYRRILMAAASSLFLIFLDLRSYLLLAALTTCIFLSRKKTRRGANFLFALSGLLIVFCGVRTAQLIQRMDHGNHWLVLLGFGFYILKLIHYSIEQHAGSFREHDFLDFYNYMLFFPTITIGPIHRFEEFLRSERRLRWDDQIFAGGLERILYGYIKVVVIANWLIAIQVLALITKYFPNPSAWSVILDSVSYGFHLYFSFSGFSDIAIGLAALFGYQVGENFDHPFLKQNIGAFWQSWHISLSTWCRQYVFLPIFSKSRSLPLALLASMITLGLWHEFSPRFLLWGAYHGIGILVWRLYQRTIKPALPLPENRIIAGTAIAFSTALTFSFVMIGFTIPRSASMTELAQNFQLILGGLGL